MDMVLSTSNCDRSADSWKLQSSNSTAMPPPALYPWYRPGPPNAPRSLPPMANSSLSASLIVGLSCRKLRTWIEPSISEDTCEPSEANVTLSFSTTSTKISFLPPADSSGPCGVAMTDRFTALLFALVGAPLDPNWPTDALKNPYFLGVTPPPTEDLPTSPSVACIGSLNTRCLSVSVSVVCAYPWSSISSMSSYARIEFFRSASSLRTPQ